jgi:hypothetical protein
MGNRGRFDLRLGLYAKGKRGKIMPFKDPFLCVYGCKLVLWGAMPFSSCFGVSKGLPGGGVAGFGASFFSTGFRV